MVRTRPYQRYSDDVDVLCAPTPSAGFCVFDVLFVSRSGDLVSSVDAQRCHFWERNNGEEPVILIFFFKKLSFPATLALNEVRRAKNTPHIYEGTQE